MGRFRFPIRFNPYSISLLLLILVLFMYAGFSRLQTQTSSTQSERTILAPDVIQKQIADAVGVLPGIQEVFVNQLADGTYMVHTTANLDENSQNAEIEAAKTLAVSFMGKVYALPLQITAAEIYIQQNDRIVFGMGVGKDHKDLFASIPVNGGVDETKQVLAKMQQEQNTDIKHPDRLVWFEHVHTP